jgi:type III secretion protein F
MASTAEIINPTSTDASWAPSAAWTGTFTIRDGFDLIWSQSILQEQMAAIETDIRTIEANANLSDTEKMFAMQMAVNTWNIIATMRTNIMKSISDVAKNICRNIA